MSGPFPIPDGYEARFPRHEEVRSLRCVGLDFSGREAFLTAGAGRAWQRMQRAAADEDVELLLISAFRGYARQAAIIQRKLDAGKAWPEILRVSALPGFSEHHTGRAVDLGTPGCTELTEDFEQTPAFAWLQEKAADFRFRLSFPRGNHHGLVYEPWHWCWQPPARLKRRARR